MENPFAIDMNAVRAFLNDKEAARTRMLAERLASAQRDFDRIVETVSKRYHPTRIWQWGSLIHTENFSEISDIDIALEGVSGPEEYFSILGDIAGMTDFPVDVIEIEKIDPETAREIRTRGRLVYDRGPDR